MAQALKSKSFVSESTKVEINDLTKMFGSTTAVQNASLTIESGEFMTLLGPSGCGKTTILSMILGILQPTSGDIIFNGQPINQIDMSRRDIGMVFQNYALFPHMTVAQNIAFGLDMRKINKAEKKKRVNEAIDMVQLTDLGNRFIKDLSGGQQQRVALARAIVIRPRVLLLDEPLSNLDAKLRKEMRTQLKKLHNELGITTIYVTHDQEEALSLSTKVTVMSNGVIQQIGTPKEIFGRPRNYFVANFIGYGNFLEGTLVDVQDEHFIFETDKDLVRLAVKQDEKHQVGDEVILTIKPEMVEIITDAKIGMNSLQGNITVSDYIGSATGYEVETAGGRTFKINVLGLNPYALGEEVKLYLDPEKLLIIDKE
ncbi:ABC transporter ATP-binding protein [Sediminibacillus halophilus]|uniref:Iron(III) transport system ATP-binding protein/putative spermidine/putrescine transport system ATP-binding protein n=1 Tax=Sediminibacillus halophilus TaxID=482461 RepID=A0A1G9U767_9BACI|nr:ABC transporter ATP-binding protein [Sediminibacillus halophilus]SDM55682.1 iron(III) transport system ATP-binding protein/putative spermidine/putrescine transport system ATP-binding protein [Sediminibacillus halophilus]